MKKMIIKLTGAYLNLLGKIAPAAAARKGFILFCRPYRSPLNEKNHAFFHTAEKLSFRNGDETIQTYRWGRGERKILFLHGWGSHSYRWKSYIEALPPDDFTIYALDAPGHGLSTGTFLTVPAYAELIRSFILSLERVDTVVSHSLGSFALLYAFHQHPLLPVNKAVLMASPGEASDFITEFKETLGLWEETVQLVLNEFKGRYDVTPDFFSAEKFAQSVNIKGLIIHDEDDKEAPYHYSRAIHRSWKKSILLTTKRFGHNLRHKSIVEAVVRFIQGDFEEDSGIKTITELRAPHD